MTFPIYGKIKLMYQTTNQQETFKFWAETNIQLGPRRILGFSGRPRLDTPLKTRAKASSKPSLIPPAESELPAMAMPMWPVDPHCIMLCQKNAKTRDKVRDSSATGVLLYRGVFSGWYNCQQHIIHKKFTVLGLLLFTCAGNLRGSSWQFWAWWTDHVNHLPFVLCPNLVEDIGL